MTRSDILLKAIRDYYPIYRKVVLDLYELLFMLVCLPEDIASDKKKIDKEVHALAQAFYVYCD